MKIVVIALGIICIILVAFLAVENNKISVLNSQISQLNSGVNSTFELLISHFSNLANQSTPLNLTGATFVTINQINLDPAKWENRRVIVAGMISGPFAFPTAISYYYVLSLNETVTSSTGLNVNSIGVDLGNRGTMYNGSLPALVVGVVEKGIIGTMGTAPPTTVYYIEEQAILTS